MTAGRKVNSLRQDWGTPPKYVQGVLQVLGKIDLDPCGNSNSLIPARVSYQLPTVDGLAASWAFATIYVNPPYGRDSENGTTIADWLVRCSNAHEQYQSEVLALIPVATNTKHWKENIFQRATAVCFLADTRLKFMVGGQLSQKGAPMACAMVYWGRNFELFQQVFNRYGRVFRIT